MGNYLKTSAKSDFLKLVVQTVSDIRSETVDQSERSESFQTLERFLKSFTIADDGTVQVIFSEELLKNDQ